MILDAILQKPMQFSEYLKIDDTISYYDSQKILRFPFFPFKYCLEKPHF